MINSMSVSQTEIHLTLVAHNRDHFFLFTTLQSALVSKNLSFKNMMKKRNGRFCVFWFYLSLLPSWIRLTIPINVITNSYIWSFSPSPRNRLTAQRAHWYLNIFLIGWLAFMQIISNMFLAAIFPKWYTNRFNWWCSSTNKIFLI